MSGVWSPEATHHLGALMGLGLTQREISGVLSRKFKAEISESAVEHKSRQIMAKQDAVSDRRSSLEKILFVPDCHIPFENHRAFALMMQVARSVGIDRIVILGDFGDFFAVSFHDKSPMRIRSVRFSEELEAINQRLNELDSLGATHKYFIEGNHEFRLIRHLETKSPELVGVAGLTIPELFRLPTRGWSFTPYRKHIKLGKVFLTHDLKRAGKRAHIEARARLQGNAVTAHTHHMGVDYQGNACGEVNVGAVFGWLGDASHIDYDHQIAAMEWPLGFGIGFMEPSGVIHLHPVPLIDYKCVVEGRIFIG